MITDSIILVLSHANNEYRKHLLKECLAKLNGEILLSTNYPVDFETQKMCNWVIYDKKNEILLKEDYHIYDVNFSVWSINEQGEKVTTPYDFDHGYAAYNLIKNGIKFANSIGKKKVHIVNYDYIIDMSEILENDDILDNHDFVIYTFTDNPEDKCPSTAIMSGKIEPLLEFSSAYNSLPEYYSTRGYLTFEVVAGNIIASITSNIYVKSFNDLKEKYQVNLVDMVNYNNNYNSKEISNRFREIGLKYECDKVSRHEYYKIYPSIFEKFLDEKINLFEIGICTGKSLKVWNEFAPNCKVYGMDIGLELINDDVKIIKGDQSNINDLQMILQEVPACDIIIDDGSHNPEHQVKTFHFLFKNLLKDGGVYVIEDIECNYWDPLSSLYGYEVGYLNIVDYFTKFNHQLNSKYNSLNNELNIEKITYAPNCIIIEKKKQPT